MLEPDDGFAAGAELLLLLSPDAFVSDAAGFDSVELDDSAAGFSLLELEDDFGA